ncbi:MAG: dienelactone hydrolase family protein [Ignavibacteriaceae bacterium]
MKKLFSVSLFVAFIAFLNIECGNKRNEPGDNSSQVINDSLKIKTMMVSYKSGNDSVHAYFAMPEGDGPFPGLIVIHEWWGLTDWIKENTDSFADDGYAALAIDLYRGKSTSNPKEAAELSGSVPKERAITDLKAAYNYLINLPKVDSEKIGSIGWCMGGGYSLQAAINIPDLSACIIAYGRLTDEINEVKKINCPVLGIFAEKDPNITPEKVHDFENLLKNEGKENHIFIYPNVSHAFMNPGNKNGYDESTANEAWNQIYSFLDENLSE